MNLTIYIITYHVFPSCPKASSPRYAAMLRLVLGCLISDTLRDCDFRASEVRDVFATTAHDKQSNLNWDSKLFSLCEDIT
jgi:hypothetical protein